MKNSFFTYCGENAAEVFLDSLQEKAGEIFNQYVKDGKQMNPPKNKWSDEQTEAFNNEPICHIWEKPFKEDDLHESDHCHYTGRQIIK